jgi:hypothetical protein
VASINRRKCGRARSTIDVRQELAPVRNALPPRTRPVAFRRNR